MSIRPSTSVLLIRDGADEFEVLMVRAAVTSSRSRSPWSSLGGVIAASDVDPRWMSRVDCSDGLEGWSGPGASPAFTNSTRKPASCGCRRQPAPAAVREVNFWMSSQLQTGGSICPEMLPFGH